MINYPLRHIREYKLKEPLSRFRSEYTESLKDLKIKHNDFLVIICKFLGMTQELRQNNKGALELEGLLQIHGYFNTTWFLLILACNSIIIF